MNFAVVGRSRRPDSSPSVLEIFSFDPNTTSLSSSPLVSVIFRVLFTVLLDYFDGIWTFFLFLFHELTPKLETNCNWVARVPILYVDLIYCCQTEFVFEECEGDLVGVAVHPSGDEIVCSTTQGGCK